MAKNLFRTKIDLPADGRAKLVDLLNQQLVNTVDLRSQTKHAHWNVKGPNFYQLHLLFDAHAGSLDEPIDEIAERLTALGGVAKSTAKDVVENTQLADYPHGTHDGMKLVEVLVDRWSTTSNGMRKAIGQADELGDEATADMLTGFVELMDKNLWFLEAHLQG